jgi:hypothetical protein
MSSRTLRTDEVMSKTNVFIHFPGTVLSHILLRGVQEVAEAITQAE